MQELVDFPALAARLDAAGLGHWSTPVEALVRQRLSPQGHGDFERWAAAIAAIPGARGDEQALKRALLALSPWRKGPFELDGVRIDAEWRSDRKWARLEPALLPLAGRTVLDVGSGNGYYALRMRAAGAGLVVGVDPTLLYVLQFIAVNHIIRDDGVFILPLRFEETPPAAGAFDTTFSMGVLYHQRAPIDHLRQLRDTLRPGGQLVLETLFMPGETSCAFTPPDRYARMRNVWLLPTLGELETWLSRTGYRGIEVVDTSVTTTDEQRSTEWMTFESLREALDPQDPGRTVEGWPAPRRVIITAINPGA